MKTDFNERPCSRKSTQFRISELFLKEFPPTSLKPIRQIEALLFQ